MAKRIISLLLCLSIMFSLSIPVSATSLTKSVAKTLVTQWVKNAKRYSVESFEKYISLFDENMAIDDDEYYFYQTYLYTNKYKCTYNIVSIEDNKIVADIFFYRNIEQNGLTAALHESHTYLFEVRNSKAVRVPYTAPKSTEEYNTDIYWIKYKKAYLCGLNFGIKRIWRENGKLNVMLVAANGYNQSVKNILLFNNFGESRIFLGKGRKTEIVLPNRVLDEIYDSTIKKNTAVEFTFSVPEPDEELDFTYCDFIFHSNHC